MGMHGNMVDEPTETEMDWRIYLAGALLFIAVAFTSVGQEHATSLPAL
jgi:hypothetical protein